MGYDYEFKEYIRDEILSNINHMKILDDALDELDHVYSQAAKADEYEAKSKAFDRICEAMDYHYPSVNDRKYLNGYQHPKASLKDIDAIINSYESGEPYAEK